MSFGAQSPDYAGAAQQQGQASINAINAQTQANRPNLNTPWGSLSWANNGGQWTGNVNLSPDQQAALDSQQKIQSGRSDLALGLEGQVAKNFNTPLDFGGLPSMPNAEAIRGQAVNATYNRAASRLDPQWQQAGDQMRTQLLNEGLDPSSEAYQKRMDTFSRQKNDAYTSAQESAEQSGAGAAQQAFSMGLGSRQQGISEMMAQRMEPFNEMQASLGGEQVGMPNFPGFAQAGTATPAPYLNAAGMQGNFSLQNNAQQQSQWADLFSGGGQLASNLYMFG